MTGRGEDTVELPVAANAGSVLEYLASKHPEFAGWRGSVRIAVNHRYVDSDHSLSEGDEVAVIPPVSGG